MKTYRGFTIVKADRGSHRWHAELDGSTAEFPRGKVADANGSIVTYYGAYFTTLRELREAIEVSRECPPPWASRGAFRAAKPAHNARENAP